MKLLVVSQYFWPENFRINDLVAELVARGHEVTVLTGRPNYPEGTIFPDYVENPDKYDSYQGAKIVRVPLIARGTGGLRLLLNYLSFAIVGSVMAPFLLRKQKFDAIFVCQLSPVIIALPGMTMRWLRRIPSIHWVLDLWPQSLEAVGAVRSPKILRFLEGLVGFIYRQSDLVLAQSRSFLPEIDRHLVAPNKALYFPSWAEALPALESVEFAPEVVSSPNTFDIVFAGNIGAAQDFPAILDAADLLKDKKVRWLIVGDGRAADWVRSEINRRDLSQSVLMMGRYPLERMPSFFRHADALLVSLRDEPIFAMTIPGKLQSYLAAGVPILAMLNGEGALVLKDSAAGIAVPAGDSSALAKAVLTLMDLDADELNVLGQNGHRFQNSQFNREKLIGRLEGILSDLA